MERQNVIVVRHIFFCDTCGGNIKKNDVGYWGTNVALLICYESQFGLNKIGGNWKPNERFIVEKTSRFKLCQNCIEEGKCKNNNNNEWNGLLINKNNNNGIIELESDIINKKISLETINIGEIILYFTFCWGEANDGSKCKEINNKFSKLSSNVKDAIILLKLDIILFGINIETEPLVEERNVWLNLIGCKKENKTLINVTNLNEPNKTTEILPTTEITTTTTKLMPTCPIKHNPIKYNNYGCYCGKDNTKGTPFDEIDKCCQLHDKCYLNINECNLNNFDIFTESMHNWNNYKYSCEGNEYFIKKLKEYLKTNILINNPVIDNNFYCDKSKNNACQYEHCFCDAILISCLANYEFNFTVPCWETFIETAESSLVESFKNLKQNILINKIYMEGNFSLLKNWVESVKNGELEINLNELEIALKYTDGYIKASNEIDNSSNQSLSAINKLENKKSIYAQDILDAFIIFHKLIHEYRNFRKQNEFSKFLNFIGKEQDKYILKLKQENN
ncbi:hypothetical protein Mgra_00009488 [Meloidogyne graminicola]|uniref:phospholipase A2 n=1 Tax=Meloidogyne graminicola TaxID=189291 RepID=A0A8S9ZB84_9BILA|nr:hypothetical protein Mgra_00009488 [Meloidogyne graminicola]